METKHFSGIDQSIDISILEYGILVSNEPNDDGSYLIIYGVNNDGNSYESFASILLSEKEVNDKIQESWFDKESFFSYCGQTEQEWLSNTIAGKMRDMLAYYGSENICGVRYYTFNEEELRKILR